MTAFLALIRRDLGLSLARGAEGLTALFFFMVALSLFPLALGGEYALIQKAAPGLIWVMALLAALLSLEALYHRDAEDGTFDLLLLAPVPPLLIVAAKMLAHWMLSGLMLALAGVVMAVMLYMPAAALPALLTSLLLGSLYMSGLGGAGALLTCGTRRPGLLLVLLVFPLYVPMLILGVMAAEAALAGLSPGAYLLLQLALLLGALPLTLLSGAWLLRNYVRS